MIHSIIYSSPQPPGVGGPGGITKRQIEVLSEIEGTQVFKMEGGQLADWEWDAVVAAHIRRMGGRVFHGWNNASLCSLLVYHHNNTGKIVIERASTYPEHQYRVLQEEFTQLNIPSPPMTEIAVKRMTHELEMCHYVLVPSEQVKESFGPDFELSFSRAIKVINFGADIETFQPPKTDPEGFNVLYLGTPWVRKGLVYLKKAWSDLTLTLPGERKRIKGRLHINVPFNVAKRPEIHMSKIRCHSWIKRLPQFMNQMHVFCLPSLEEGQVIAVWDAMAAGLPCVITKECGFEGIFQDGKHGFVIPSRNTKAIKKALLYLYENPGERKRMGREARKLAESRTWEDYKRELREFYESLL